jgi:hypothetical protein
MTSELVAPDRERVTAFVAEHLGADEPVPVRQHPDCALTVVVPLLREDPLVVLRQLESICEQDVDKRKIEVLYVVNNGREDNAEQYLADLAANQRVLALPVFANRRVDDTGWAPEIVGRCDRINRRLTVLAIDKSTSGHEIPDNNIGRSRNRGLAEAVSRFGATGGNGIVFFTDADTWLTDPTHLSKAITLFHDRPEVVAVAGLWKYVVNASEVMPDVADAAGTVRRYLLERIFRSYIAFLGAADPEQFLDEYDPFRNYLFVGRQIVVRANEAAFAGGFGALHLGEDLILGERMRDYAIYHRRKVLGPRFLPPIMTEMRRSNRTANDALSHVDDLRPAGLTHVAHPQTGEVFALTEADLARLENVVTAQPHGPYFVKHCRTVCPVRTMRIVG